jgi:hypothetical protein
MNRAARRAAGMKKSGISVRNRVAVVPMEHTESYLTHEILNEGRWASDKHLIILQPPIDRGRADADWVATTLERMWETRRRKGTLPMKVAIGNGEDVEIDVGLIDVTVFFQMPPGVPAAIPAREEDWDLTLTENLRHLDSVCAGALHDQMILATTPHRFHSDGSPLLHYHNLILGMRQEVRGDMDMLGPLDMEPLLKALGKSGPVSVIGGMARE